MAQGPSTDVDVWAERRETRRAVPEASRAPRGARARLPIARVDTVVVLLVPSGLIFGLALASGGFFPDSVAVAVVAVLLILAIRTAAMPAPFSGLSRGLRVVAVALIAFTTWTLVSGWWSGSSARATLEYNRALLYTTVFVLMGALGRSHSRARALLYGMTVACVVISIAATATWLAPDLFRVADDAGRLRLSWPTSYWNATGLIAALALVWTSSLSCSSTEPPRVRVLAAMAAPVPAATLIFTVSRGAVAVAVLGLLLAVWMIRSSATPGGVATLVPAIAVAVAIALAVNGLAVAKPAAHAVSAGHRTALLLLGVALAAGALRFVLLRLDARLAVIRAPWTRTQARVALGVVAAVVVVAFLAFGGPDKVRGAVHRFGSQSVSQGLPARERLTQLGGNGRIEAWHVALVDGFLRHPLLGTGAGTYATLWTRYAPPAERILDAHSVYLGQLAELGIIGTGLLVGAIAAMLVALAWRARGPERQVWAALLAGGVMWALHAGVDWDWEMPAVTVWFFAAGALALAAPLDRRRLGTPSSLRFAIGLGCLLLAVTPALIWRSQTQLIKAVTALQRGDCVAAESAALASNAALSSRPEPFEVISYCEAAAQRFPLALSAIRAAEQRDPQNWELYYSDALISAAAGLDPRPAARAALVRYPTSPLTRAAAQAFSKGDPRGWRQFALSAPLPVPPTLRLPSRR